MSDTAADVSVPPATAADSTDPACDVAHGRAEVPASTRTLVAVFTSPVARFLLSYARDAGYRAVLLEPDAGHTPPGPDGEPSAPEPSAPGTSADQTSADETSADETSADETRADRPSADGTRADRPSADETSADGPGGDGTRADRPSADGFTTAASLAGLADEATDIVVCDHHRPELGPVLRDALASPARWVGVLGNPRHPAPHIPALAALGVPADEIARVHRPIGLNIGSRTPAEIALATMAGLIADRNGRPGGFHF